MSEKSYRGLPCTFTKSARVKKIFGTFYGDSSNHKLDDAVNWEAINAIRRGLYSFCS